MREKSNEWVSISDLMAGILAVVMLLLVVSVLQQIYERAKHEAIVKAQEAELNEVKSKIEEQKKQASNVLKEIEKMFQDRGLKDLLHVDFDQFKIMLKEGLFLVGSACIRKEVSSALSLIRSYLDAYFHANSVGLIQIEGHTDNLPVSTPVINYRKYCTVYDDNYTLSAARAREAMKAIWTKSVMYQNRIIVAGFGSSRPISEFSPNSPAQRRVEITFTFPTINQVKETPLPIIESNP
jgi:chemotaxis protein MotB